MPGWYPLTFRRHGGQRRGELDRGARVLNRPDLVARRRHSVSRRRHVRDGRLAGRRRQTKDLSVTNVRGGISIASRRPRGGRHRVSHRLLRLAGEGHARRDLLVDLIFANGNGLAKVDDEWFYTASGSRAGPARADLRRRGDDLVEIVRDGARALRRLGVLQSSAVGATAHWHRLMRRFDEHARRAALHLPVLFLYVYPDAQAMIPSASSTSCGRVAS